MTHDRLLAAVALLGILILAGMRIIDGDAVIGFLVGLGLTNPVSKPPTGD